jgi:ribosome-associated toxin RatA of RatAB toxin-antitoxin module
MAESKGLTDSIVVNTDVDTVMQALLAFEDYPEWMSAVEKIEVLKRDKKKRGTQIKYTVDVMVKNIEYTLAYAYKENHIDITYVEGELDDCNSYYEFAPLSDDRTEVTYHYDVTYSLPKALQNVIARRMLKQVDKKVMNSALKDLKKRAEQL